MVVVRETKEEDVPAILKLVKELALYEKSPEQVINTEEDMLRDGFGKNPLFKSIVAIRNNTIIGTAVFFVAYSTWKGKYIYLDDIVVTASERRTGAGTLLFNEVLNAARRENAKQLRWHVLNWNIQAINFYEKYKCSFDTEWITCKIEKENLPS